MRHAHQPLRVAEAHSETAYTTNRAIEFFLNHGLTQWCLHLSYIKPLALHCLIPIQSIISGS